MTAIINIAMALLVAPLFGGWIRKYIRARFHSRQGPPVLQPFYDIFKLLGKEDLRSTPSAIIDFGPPAVLGAMLTAALLTPMGHPAPLGEYGDLIVFVHMITIAVVATILVGLATPSPFAAVGSAREIMMHLVVEPTLIIALVTVAVKARSVMLGDMADHVLMFGWTPSIVISVLALLASLQAQMGKLPFDIAEADQEIMGGPFVEISGPPLALFHWAQFAKQMVYTSLLVAVFFPWGLQFEFPLNLLIHLAKVFVVFVISGLIDVLSPRIRIEQAMFYFVIVIAMAIAGLGLAVAGY